MDTFDFVIAGCIAVIGSVIIISFKCLSKALNYIGGGLFFLYMLIIALPILALVRFKRFRRNPKQFVKDMVIKTTKIITGLDS